MYEQGLLTTESPAGLDFNKRTGNLRNTALCVFNPLGEAEILSALKHQQQKIAPLSILPSSRRIGRGLSI